MSERKWSWITLSYIRRRYPFQCLKTNDIYITNVQLLGQSVGSGMLMIRESHGVKITHDDASSRRISILRCTDACNNSDHIIEHRYQLCAIRDKFKWYSKARTSLSPEGHLFLLFHKRCRWQGANPYLNKPHGRLHPDTSKLTHNLDKVSFVLFKFDYSVILYQDHPVW